MASGSRQLREDKIGVVATDGPLAAVIFHRPILTRCNLTGERKHIPARNVSHESFSAQGVHDSNWALTYSPNYNSFAAIGSPFNGVLATIGRSDEWNATRCAGASKFHLRGVQIFDCQTTKFAAHGQGARTAPRPRNAASRPSLTGSQTKFKTHCPFCRPRFTAQAGANLRATYYVHGCY